jgi:hypothetical protein
MRRRRVAKCCALRHTALLLSAAVWPAAAGAQTTVRVVTFNTQGDVNPPTPATVIPQLETVIEGIGQQDYVGDSVFQLPDVIALQETTSNSVTVQPLVNLLNSTYGLTIYNSSSYQATQSGGDTDGNGPNALIYNERTMNLLASVGIGTPQGSGNGEYRQVVRYEFQPLVDVGTSNGIFYVYDCHAKSLSSGSQSTDQTYQAEEATIIRNDEATLPSNASVLYMGDWNVNASTDPSMVEMTSTGQGQAFDAMNPTNSSENWATNNAYLSLMTESDTDLRYRDDIQFMTSNVLNDAAGSLDYIANSMHVFGNNGTTTEGHSINSVANTSLNDIVGNSYPGVATLTPAQVLTAMNSGTGSDHLPVVGDYADTAPLMAAAWDGSLTGGTSWAAAVNWSGFSVPNLAQDDAVFGPWSSTPQTITLDGAQTAGVITFDSSNSYTLAPGKGGSLTMNNGSNPAAILDYLGSHTISAPLILTSSTQVTFSTAGSVLLLSGGVSGTGGLTITGGGTVRLAVNTHTTTLGGLVVGTGSKFDIANNTILINFTPPNDPVSGILTALRTGYAGGAWTGNGIDSSAVAGVVSPILSVGYVDGNSDSGTVAAPNTVMIKLTLAGDANLDGSVDFNDLLAVGQHLNTSGNDWAEGNFNYLGNGAVSFNDLAILGQNLNKSIGALGSSADEVGGTTLPLGESTSIQNTTAVPEPCGMLLAAVLGGGLLRARRRRRGAAVDFAFRTV